MIRQSGEIGQQRNNDTGLTPPTKTDLTFLIQPISLSPTKDSLPARDPRPMLLLAQAANRAGLPG